MSVLVKINPKKVEDYNYLGGRSRNFLKGPFPTMKDVFMMAVAYGFKNDKEKSLPKPPHDLFREDVFSQQDIAVLTALYISKHGMTIDESITDIEKVIRQAEKWAEGGFSLLRQNTMGDGDQDNIFSMVDLINEFV